MLEDEENITSGRRTEASGSFGEKQQHQLSHSESPTEILHALNNPISVAQSPAAFTDFPNQSSRSNVGASNIKTVEPPSDSSSNSFVIVSNRPGESIPPIVTRDEKPTMSLPSQLRKPELRARTDISTLEGQRSLLESIELEQEAIPPVIAKPSQEEYIDDKTRWRLRENQLLQIVNELETNLRGSRREAENQKIQVLATQQRLTSEIESLSRELFSLKNSLSSSRSDCTRLFEENARIRALAAGLDEEKQSLVLKLSKVRQENPPQQTYPSRDGQSSTVSKPITPNLNMLHDINRELHNCLEEFEGLTKEQLNSCVRKFEQLTDNNDVAVEPKIISNQLGEAHSLRSSRCAQCGNQCVSNNPEGKDLNQRNEVKRLQEMVTDLDRKIVEHSVFKNEMIRKNETLERRVQQVQEEKQVALEALKQNMTQLLQENKRVTKDYLDQSMKAECLRANSDECLVKVGEVEGKFVFLEKELQSKSLALDISSEEATRHRKELAALKSQLNETRDRYEILEQSKEVLAKRCLSLEQIIEGIKMNNLRNVTTVDANGVEERDYNQVSDNKAVLEDRYEAVLNEKFALQKKCDEHDGRIHCLQEHIFDLEAELRARDEEVEVMRKQTIERETKLNLQKAEINKIISKAEAIKSSGEQAAGLDEFGLRPADQDVVTQLLKALFPSFFKDKGLRVI